jgi:hypothetical protein
MTDKARPPGEITVGLRERGDNRRVDTEEVLGLSESTVKRDRRMAKVWLRRELTR